jgi:hypothetical protein
MHTPGRRSFAEAPLLDAAADHSSLLRWREMAAIAFSGLAFFWPGLIVLGLRILWGSYSQVRAELKLRKAVDGAWILALDGTGAIPFGVAIVLWPQLETVVLVWLVSWFAFALGSVYLDQPSRLTWIKSHRGGWAKIAHKGKASSGGCTVPLRWTRQGP